MSLSDSISRAKFLIQQLRSCPLDIKATQLAASLSDVILEIETSINRLKHNNNFDTSSTPQTPDMKSGCYIFSDEKGFFCPRCYDKDNKKVPTTRLNSKLRVCPVCRESISS